MGRMRWSGGRGRESRWSGASKPIKRQVRCGARSRTQAPGNEAGGERGEAVGGCQPSDDEGREA